MEDYVSTASNNGRILRIGAITKGDGSGTTTALTEWGRADGWCHLCGVWCRTDQSIIHEWFMERQLQDDLRKINYCRS